MKTKWTAPFLIALALLTAVSAHAEESRWVDNCWEEEILRKTPTGEMRPLFLITLEEKAVPANTDVLQLFNTLFGAEGAFTLVDYKPLGGVIEIRVFPRPLRKDQSLEDLKKSVDRVFSQLETKMMIGCGPEFKPGVSRSN